MKGSDLYLRHAGESEDAGPLYHMLPGRSTQLALVHVLNLREPAHEE